MTVGEPKNRCKIIVKWACPSLRLSEIEGLWRDVERRPWQNVLSFYYDHRRRWKVPTDNQHVEECCLVKKKFGKWQGTLHALKASAAAAPQNISHFHQTAFQWSAPATESVAGDEKVGEDSASAVNCGLVGLSRELISVVFLRFLFSVCLNPFIFSDSSNWFGNGDAVNSLNGMCRDKSEWQGHKWAVLLEQEMRL